MEAKALRELPEAELRQKLSELQRDLVLLKVKKRMGQLPNTAAVRNVRRDIARILTVLRERELQVRAERNV